MVWEDVRGDNGGLEENDGDNDRNEGRFIRGVFEVRMGEVVGDELSKVTREFLNNCSFLLM